MTYSSDPQVEIAQTSSMQDEDIELLLDLLFSHNMEFIQDFLKERQLHYSYTKTELRDRVRDYWEREVLRFEELVQLLNQIEGWGDQHIYLYKAPFALSRHWSVSANVQTVLERVGCLDLFNRSRPLLLPDEPTLSSIEWSEARVRFVWIERRVWKQRDEKLDQLAPVMLDAVQVQSEPVEWHAYRVKSSRGLIAFDWDLVSSEAMMLIHRLPSGSDYLAVKKRFEQALHPIVSLDAFEPVRVSRAVRRLEQSDRVRRHHLKYLSDNRGQVSFTSPSSQHDAFDDDPVIERTRAALRDEAVGLLGRFYWKPVPEQLSSEVYTLIYGENADDQRIGILKELREKDVRFVLSGIRDNCG